MTRRKPKIDLVAYADEHLRYEAWMFVTARSVQCRQRSFEMNLKAEACALHFRNLFEFFYPAHPRENDVITTDYVADWDAKRPAATQPLKQARKRADKELAHLTTGRIAGTPANKQCAASARVKIAPRCRGLIEDLKKVRWARDSYGNVLSILDKRDPKLTRSCDAFGYLLRGFEVGSIFGLVGELAQ